MAESLVSEAAVVLISRGRSAPLLQPINETAIFCLVTEHGGQSDQGIIEYKRELLKATAWNIIKALAELFHPWNSSHH